MLNDSKRPASNGKRGRPKERVIKLDATPERVARAMFSAVRKPDPSTRKAKAR